jgi:hypothetical protein
MNAISDLTRRSGDTHDVALQKEILRQGPETRLIMSRLVMMHPLRTPTARVDVALSPPTPTNCASQPATHRNLIYEACLSICPADWRTSVLFSARTLQPQKCLRGTFDGDPSYQPWRYLHGHITCLFRGSIQGWRAQASAQTINPIAYSSS